MVRRQPRSRSICPNNPGPKKMGRTYLSKIPTISSNPHTIMLLLIVGEFGYPEVEDVKCCSPVTISPKAHSGCGLTINELIHHLEDQCIATGRKLADNLPPREEPSNPLPDSKPAEPKFHFCMNYGELNKSTLVRPMPQGNICGMQQNLSSKHWISKFDFASGFYAC